MATSRIEGDRVYTGSVTYSGNINTLFARTQFAQESLVPYPVALTDIRVWNAIQTNLPGTAAADDLAIVGNTFATGSPSLQTSDAKATTVTQYGRFLFSLPSEYEAAQTVLLRIQAGMNTTISDGTATVDVQCYESDKQAGVGADLVTTTAQSINSTTFGPDNFTITAGGLEAGNILDVRITVAITDTATGTAVIGEIGAIEFLLDIRG